MRWVEVAPPGSTARLVTIGGIDLDPAPMEATGAPRMFMLRDPDGNTVVVVETLD